uniref:Uncharacterized protein C20orf112-like n=1 Tax=Saccoglossus kowalevskii TaxID=10224 RepID=A0ABM0MWT3_SACKO|nr:PREDICTED: uncharacterized protein C20orf112-like [Saccoglossus kowalevskii]
MSKKTSRRRLVKSEDNESLTSGDTEISEPSLNSSGDLTVDSPQPMDFKNGDENSSRASSPARSKDTGSQPLDMSGSQTTDRPFSLTGSTGRELRSSSGDIRTEADARKYEASTNGHLSFGEAGRVLDGAEDLSTGREDDDDDCDDDSDKFIDTPPQGVDPERLKAFNMFVRLFVDENLDRMVPISKQPKDKIQAIIDATYRQFPELHERSRKRIRTYLKSCRRMKRNRDANGIDVRPTPPHLTSAAAESMLAAACQSESENAKRMRLELEQQQQQQQQGDLLVQQNQYSHDIIRADRRATEYKFTNGFEGFHAGGMPPPVTAAPHHTGIIHQQHATPLTNGPTDLSMKKGSTSKPQLNPSEVQTIKQLIAGYRESAAFLLRSADELEQLLLQSN